MERCLMNSIIVMNKTMRNGEEVLEWPLLKLLSLFEEETNKNKELEKRIEELEKQIKLLQLPPLGRNSKPPYTPYKPWYDAPGKWYYKKL
jgi:hypothetical protein